MKHLARIVEALCAVAIVCVLAFVGFLGGCASTIPPGPTFEQTSDAGTTRLVNQPPGALGIREEGINWAATGTAGVKAVRISDGGVLQLGSGPATRQIVWNPATNALVVSSETDFEVARAQVFTPEGTPLYDVQGFKTSSTAPTSSLAGPLAAWGESFRALSADQRAVVIEALQQETARVQAITPTAGSVLEALIHALVPVP